MSEHETKLHQYNFQLPKVIFGSYFNFNSAKYQHFNNQLPK